ncbi:pirin-like C-terminal cupin domain-containing protein, partial [Gelidibacter salicanalis]
SINADGYNYGPKQILVAKDSTLCSFEMEPETTVYIFGGIPFEEERYIHWNFVNSDRDVIEKAKKDWEAQNLEAFPKVVGDEHDYVPLPKPRRL